MMKTTGTAHDRVPQGRRVLASLGIAGFVFFLAKGLVWLALGAVVFQGCRTSIE